MVQVALPREGRGQQYDTAMPRADTPAAPTTAPASVPAAGGDSFDEQENAGFRLEAALHAYIGRVAGEFGLGTESISCEVADWASGYIALTERLPGWGQQDAALWWDQHHGWGLAIEPNPGGALTMLAYQGETLVPAAHEVAMFVHALFVHPERLPGAAVVPPRFEQTDLARLFATRSTT